MSQRSFASFVVPDFAASAMPGIRQYVFVDVTFSRGKTMNSGSIVDFIAEVSSFAVFCFSTVSVACSL